VVGMMLGSMSDKTVDPNGYTFNRNYSGGGTVLNGEIYTTSAIGVYEDY
jgi:hypothetical protein